MCKKNNSEIRDSGVARSDIPEPASRLAGCLSVVLRSVISQNPVQTTAAACDAHAARNITRRFDGRENAISHGTLQSIYRVTETIVRCYYLGIEKKKKKWKNYQ